jgi:AcrR family transcriptional regulator
MSSVIDSKPRWERRKDARPQELLAAALDLFVERGFAATRLEDVAKLAGVSKGTLYLYFTNKEEMFKTVVRENILPTLCAAEEAIHHFEGDSGALLRLLIMRWWEQVGDTKLSGLSKLIIAEAGNFPELARFYHDEVISRSDAMISRVLQRGIACGEFRAVDTMRLTKIITAPIIMLMLWKHSFGPCQAETISPMAYLDDFVDLCINGLMQPNTNLNNA